MSRVTAVAAATALIIGAPTNSAVPQPQVTEDQAMRIVAASPLREFYRNWKQCVDETLLLMNMTQTADVHTIENWVEMNCDEAESRLTGELIKRQGYDRGNAIIATFKRSNRLLYQRLGRGATKPQGFVEQVGDWTIKRQSSGRCMAGNSNQALFAPQASMLVYDKTEWRLYFLKFSSRSEKYQGKRLRTERSQIGLTSDQGVLGRFSRDMRFEVERDFFGWSTSVDDSLISLLSTAKNVQFTALPEEQNVDWVFPVRGVAEAWAAVRRCSQAK